MTAKLSYSYTILRYVHDVITGEFVNVGVVLHVPSLGLLECRARRSVGRIRATFPDLDRSAFASAMRSVVQSVERLRQECASDGLLASTGDAGTLARRAIPDDDSSLQWSPFVGTGLTEDPAKTMERLYSRFVGRYDAPSRYGRTDNEVWRPVRQQLEARQIAGVLRKTTISGAIDDVVFKHAWKNGRWHCYEPVSFDLVDADGIKTKAREWLGHLTAVADGGAEPFELRFVVGAPTKPELRRAYEAALAILRRAPFSPKVFEESQVDAFVALIEDELRADAPQVLAAG